MRVIAHGNKKIILELTESEWYSLTYDRISYREDDNLVDKEFDFISFLNAVRATQVAFECKEKILSNFQTAIESIEKTFWPLSEARPILKKKDSK